MSSTPREDRNKSTPDAADKAAPGTTAATTAPGTVRARVRPNNKYGGVAAGGIVEVDARELVSCRHALISLDEEAATEAAAKAPPPKTEAQQFYGRLKKQAIEAANQREIALRERRRRELEGLGLKVSG